MRGMPHKQHIFMMSTCAIFARKSSIVSADAKYLVLLLKSYSHCHLKSDVKSEWWLLWLKT